MEQSKRSQILMDIGIDIWSWRKTADEPETDTSLNWKRLEENALVCTACELATSRTRVVFGTGNKNASLLIIGEAPGKDEDLKGEPFVGRAGLLLNEMLRAINLKREDVFIANILKCRPPNNRDPSVDEITNCKHFLDAQIKLINPTVILCVGRIAAQALMKTTASIGSLRGKEHHLEDSIPLIVTYHPAYLLRKPTEKAKSWQDLKLLVNKLNPVL